jgi:LuxR family maltose regulon positive regulatory protein
MLNQVGASLPESLIATKFIPTEFDSRLVSRRPLFEGLMGKNCGRSVLSIVATAGSGKSTVMAELHRALVDQGAKACWLSLDCDDDSVAAFAAYFVCALRSADPTLVPNELALLRGNQVQDFTELFEQLVRRISNISADFAIFLDDFQHIGDSHILAFVNRLASHLPPCVRLVIASRSHLPLDLGRLRVRGLLVEIEQDALNFDPSKTAELLQRVHGLDLSKSDLDALMATTEGWPTAIQLAALALHRYRGPARELIDSFSGRDRDLTSYLVESVLRSQPKEISDFLFMTAPLRRMSSDLCMAVSGYPKCDEMLANIQRCNLFLIPLDRQGHWYRYHHLFAEFLQNELRRIDPQKYQFVCERAAQWCEGSGHTTEAIQYTLDCGHYAKASDLIAEHALTVSQRNGDHYTIFDWMRRLPPEHQESRPEILLGHAWSLAFSHNSYQAVELANRVLAGLRNDTHDGWSIPEDDRIRLRLVAQVTQTVAEATSDQLEACIARAMDLRAKIPESEPFLIAAISNSLGYCYFAKRDFDKCAAAAADAYLYGHRSGADYATGWADFLHGLADLELGKIRSAQEHSQRMSETVMRGGAAHSYIAGLASLLNAEIATQRCEFAKAKIHVEEAQFFTEVFGPLEPLLLAIRNQARQFAVANQIDDARRVLMNGQDLALKIDQPRLFLTLAIEEAVLRLNAGDLAGAMETANRTRLQDDKNGLRRLDGVRGVREALQLFEARQKIASGDAPAALRLLSLMQHASSSDKGASMALTVTAVKAIALWRCERHTEAIRELDRVLTQGSAEFHAYPLFNAGPDLLPVLRAIGEHRSGAAMTENSEARNRLERCLVVLLSGEKYSHEPAHPRAVEPGGPWEPLTDRETQLLRLVEAGLGNKQLSKELLISEATVKWHLHNVYAKIGVRSRTAATARARELRLI